MAAPFKARKVMEDVHWVGAIDWTGRDFHGYRTERGTTYNAYLILGEKITLVDTVKAPFRDEMLARIASVIDPSRIDYIISNHAEMDHSGCLPDVIDLVKPEKVFASTLGVAALKAHFHRDLGLTAMKDGAELVLSLEGAQGGPLTVKFLETRFLHWPDSMFSYLPERGLLFTQDAFGMHLATSERFADEVPEWLLKQEAGRYFANILMPFAPTIQQLLAHLEGLGLDIRMTAPDHGPIWRRGLAPVLDWYRAWAAQAPTRKAVVLYDTMWGSTDLMARSIGEGLTEAGAEVKLMPLSGSHRSDVAAEVLEAGALVVGSPTLNNQLFPTVADATTYLKGLKPKNLVGATFGSFGWSGEAIKHLDALLEEMGIENLGHVRTQYVPREAILEACRELGAKVGARLLERAGS